MGYRKERLINFNEERMVIGGQMMFGTVMVYGYDKLKPFEFPIHASMDGWSRKIQKYCGYMLHVEIICHKI